MKSQRLLYILGLLEDDLLAEAEDSMPAYRPGRSTGLKWLSAAACLLVAVGIAFWYRGVAPAPVPPPPVSESSSPGGVSPLPMLTVDTEWGGAMGFEGYMANDISDLVNANPWKEGAELATLPVFRNVNAYHKGGDVQEPNLEVMEQTLLEAARSLGMDTERLEVTNDLPDEKRLKQITEKYAAVGEEVPPEVLKIGRLFLQDDRYKLEVNAECTVKLEFVPTLQLPQGHFFGFYSSYDELLPIAGYLQKEYQSFINLNKPVLNLSGGDYSLTDPPQQGYSVRFFEGEGSLADQIVSYNLQGVSFSGDDDGRLWLARRYHTDLSQKLGDYPIITAEKARQLLAEGHYITTVPEDFPGAQYIRKTELIYRTGAVKAFMPYYRIYVEMPTMVVRGHELKTYGAYYVPAVEERYLTNMPLWDGSFN